MISVAYRIETKSGTSRYWHDGWLLVAADVDYFLVDDVRDEIDGLLAEKCQLVQIGELIRVWLLESSLVARASGGGSHAVRP